MLGNLFRPWHRSNRHDEFAGEKNDDVPLARVPQGPRVTVVKAIIHVPQSMEAKYSMTRKSLIALFESPVHVERMSDAHASTGPQKHDVY